MVGEKLSVKVISLVTVHCFVLIAVSQFLQTLLHKEYTKTLEIFGNSEFNIF